MIKSTGKGFRAIAEANLGGSTYSSLFLAGTDSIIYYYNPVMSTPPRRFCLTPNKEQIISLVPCHKSATLHTLYAAVKSGVYLLDSSVETHMHSRWIKLGTLTATALCLAESYNSNGAKCPTLYVGTDNGIYSFVSPVALGKTLLYPAALNDPQILCTRSDRSSGGIHLLLKVNKLISCQLNLYTASGRKISSYQFTNLQPGIHPVVVPGGMGAGICMIEFITALQRWSGKQIIQ
jgi:hypothetical protein